MSADFWAGYLSGAAGIVIGNPLDLLKTRVQAGGGHYLATSHRNFREHFDRAGTLVRGTTAPILGYGALNALLFVTYNRTLAFFNDSPTNPSNLAKVWCAGAAGGLATFVVSAPTELIKCRAQVYADATSSWSIARDTWRQEGIRGLYHGGAVTSVRDSMGYGFYFWSYELLKQSLSRPDESDSQTALKVLFCGGVAGIITWASIFPLDVIKTRVQTQSFHPSVPEHSHLLPSSSSPSSINYARRLSATEIARQTYRNEGIGAFFRGLGICSVRAFIVNAVQWAVYEWMMNVFSRKNESAQIAAGTGAGTGAGGGAGGVRVGFPAGEGA